MKRIFLLCVALLATLTVSAQKKQSAPKAVDLGLSVKWADRNVGASNPEDVGSRYAWGETEVKDESGSSNYKWRSPYGGVKKYFVTHWTRYSLPNGGTLQEESLGDNLKVLEKQDDAASANLGKKWRMPTKSEFDELKRNCNWEFTTLNGVKGYKITSKTNSNYIFLPLIAKEGFYWTSSLYVPNNDFAWLFIFDGDGYARSISFDRYLAVCIRAVRN